MLRILVIVTLVGYVLYKLGLFRGIFNPLVNKGPGPGRNFSRPNDGNVNIDSVPEDKQPTRKSRHQGGEYVDYEEVK